MNKYVSGIRPSGKLHLGNYLGAIKHWKTLQDAGEECFFFVADMHGMYEEIELNYTFEALQKCGIKNVKMQSECANELLHLQHCLSFYAKTSRLDNMTQYKDKGGTLALYAYPVLMAADILYHEATHVPIGDDQKQHLELVRELARAINRKEPEAIINPIGARIMDLKDPTKKMSKSNPDPDGIIYLCDSKDEIARKIKGATTSMNVDDITASARNLWEIYAALGGIHKPHNKWSDFKKDLIDLLIETLT